MVKTAPVMTVAFAEYADESRAKRTLEALQNMERDGTIDIVDAAVIVKQDDGKVKISDTARHARRKAAGAGALIGGVTGLLFPPGILLTAGVGAVAGAVVGKLRHKEAFKNATMEQAAKEMPPGSSAVVAVVEERWLEQLQTAAAGYQHLITQALDAEAADSATAVLESGVEGEGKQT